MRSILPVLGIFVGALFISPSVVAQEKKTEKSSAGLRTVNVRGVIKQIRPEDEQYEGTTYLGDEWKSGTLVLSGGRVMKEQSFQYDVNAQKVVMVLKGSDKPQFINEGLIKQFVWSDKDQGRDRTFIDPRQYSLPPHPDGRGFMEVVYHTGSKGYGIYQHHSAFLRKPNYTPGITVNKGSKSWVKRETLWLYSNGKYIKLPNGRRRKEKLFEAEGIDTDKCRLKDYDHKEAQGLKKYFTCVLGEGKLVQPGEDGSE